MNSKPASKLAAGKMQESTGIAYVEEDSKEDSDDTLQHEQPFPPACKLEFSPHAAAMNGMQKSDTHVQNGQLISYFKQACVPQSSYFSDARKAICNHQDHNIGRGTHL